MSASIFMASTEIPPERSAADITALLVRSGATQISTDYREGKLIGLKFVLRIGPRECLFELPARTDGVLQLLLKQNPFNRHRRCSRSEYEASMRVTAERVGWRQLFRWCQAQVAMIETGMAAAHEVFLPYMLIEGRTVLRMFEEQTLKLLPSKTPDVEEVQ